MKFIICKGGLGNQMFQYAFYLSLLNKGANASIDTTMYEIVKMHNGFELSRVFGIQHSSAQASFILKKWIQFLSRYRPKLLVYKDSAYKYDKDVFYASQKYLLGDWISYLYFEDIECIIKKNYSFKDINSTNLDTAAIMKSTNSVSIHIRRGDYLNLTNYNVCDEKYYTDAIKAIKERVVNPVFYIFSNDIVWSTEFIKKFDVRYIIVDNNQGADSYQDMYLMTQCKHNIIANSTFSWWGAWLNDNSHKIVIAPNKWFRNNNLSANLPEWILINVEK